jgi:hypothetical protein
MGYELLQRTRFQRGKEWAKGGGVDTLWVVGGRVLADSLVGEVELVEIDGEVVAWIGPRQVVQKRLQCHVAR